jgi:surfactin family lipopeptide synthetase A
MVPSTFVFLEALPLTSNGKVDRKALPAPDQSRRELEQSFVAPRTPVEKMIAKVWAEVLQLEHVGIHDNFFEVGGHSLKAVQLIARVCQGFEIELPLRRLFETPTIGGLAETVETLCWAKQNAAQADDGRISEEETGEV